MRPADISLITELEGLIPICASCKKIRDDKGYWNRVESYIEAHSEAEFTHDICPECSEELYANMQAKIRKRKKPPRFDLGGFNIWMSTNCYAGRGGSNPDNIPASHQTVETELWFPFHM